jgi:hypothetical protein
VKIKKVRTLGKEYGVDRCHVGNIIRTYRRTQHYNLCHLDLSIHQVAIPSPTLRAWERKLLHFSSYFHGMPGLSFSFIFTWVPNFAKTNGFRQHCGVVLVPTPELLLKPFFLLQPYSAMTPNSSNAPWEHGRQCCLFWVNFCNISIW